MARTVPSSRIRRSTSEAVGGTDKLSRDGNDDPCVRSILGWRATSWRPARPNVVRQESGDTIMDVGGRLQAVTAHDRHRMVAVRWIRASLGDDKMMAFFW